MDSIKSSGTRNHPNFGRKGQSMVELAIVLPLLLLIIFGVIDLGRAFYTSVVLSNVAREGARYAALNPTSTAGQIRTAALIESTGSGIALGETNIVLTPLTPVKGQPYTVTVNYDFELVMGWFLGSSIPLSQSVVMYIP